MPTQIDFTIKKDGSGDYTSIKSFVTAEAKDLVAADENLFITIFGDGWDSLTPLSETFIDFISFTTDATRNITFSVREEDRHDFTAGSGFVFTISTSFGFVMRAKHIVLDGLEIANTLNTNNLFDTSTNAKMTNCLVHDVDYSQFQGDGENNLHYNYASRGGFTNTFYNGGTLKNITCIQLLTEGGFTGDIGIANANCTNVVLYTDKPTGSFTNFYNCTGDYNAANKAEGQPGANSFDTVLITDFVDFANEKYISKLGGQLDGSGESGGFIGAVLESGGSGELTVDDSSSNSNSISNNDSIKYVGKFLVSDSLNSSDSSVNQDSISFASIVNISDTVNGSLAVANNDNIYLVGELIVNDSIVDSGSAARDDSITLAATIIVNDSLIDSISLAVNDSIRLSGAFNVVDQLINSASIANNDSVSFSSNVVVSEQLSNSESVSNDDNVSFVGYVVIGEQLANSLSLASIDSISFTGEVIITDSAVNSNSLSTNDFIQIGAFEFTVYKETNISSLSKSRNINSPSLSTNIDG